MTSAEAFEIAAELAASATTPGERAVAQDGFNIAMELLLREQN